MQELVLVYQPIQSPQQTRSKDVIHKRKATFLTQCIKYLQYSRNSFTRYGFRVCVRGPHPVSALARRWQLGTHLTQDCMGG